MTVEEQPVVRVLVIDDHEMVAQSVMRMLGDQADIEVVGTAGSAADALSLARTTRPDVVVMDYQLPDADGVSTAARIRAERPETAVLLLTGSGSDERLLLAAVEAGCSGFLTKSKAVAELVSAIRVIATGEAWIPQELVTKLLPRLDRTYRGLGSDLTPRELEVLRLAAGGLSNAAIASELFLSVNTVRNHVQNAIAKLQAHSKLEAVAVAVREGLIAFPGR